MSLSLCRTRTNNECSLGSRFDWFVVRLAHSPKDPNVKVLPKVLARVYSIYDAEVLVKYHRDLAKTKGEDCATYCSYNYLEMQVMLGRFDNRILSFPDVFYDKDLNCD